MTAQQPPAEAQDKWKSLIGTWQRRAEAAGYEGVEGAMEAAEAQAQGGGVAADGSLTYAGQRKAVEHMAREIRDAIALLHSIQQRAEAIDCQPMHTAPQSAPVGVEALTSALQSMRDRLMTALPPKFGDAFDGDFDTLLEAINALKSNRGQNLDALAQQPASDGGFTAADMMDARQEGRKEAQQPASDPKLVFGLGEAKALVEFFGGSNTAVVVQHLPAGQLMSRPAGLYAWCDECPEEGSVYLGPVDTETDEHDDAPQQPAAVDGALELVRDIAEQKPEKPDYWSSCSQCESNIDRAQEVLAAQPGGSDVEWKS